MPRPKEIESEKINDDISAWLNGERGRLDKQRQDYLEQHDMKSFWKAPKGTTSISLLRKMPRLTKGEFGEKMAFRVNVSGAEFDWGISQRSPLYRFMISMLDKAPVVLEVTRVGEGKSTRYEVEEKT